MCDVGQKEKEFQFAKNLSLSENVELSLPLFKKVVDEVSPFHPSIAFVATEPLLYGQVVSASQYVKRKGLTLSITTNGFLLEKVAEQFVEMGLDDLWVSLDGMRPLHDSIRGVPGSYGKALEGIRRIQLLKRETISEKPRLHINYTISDLNSTGLYEFAGALLHEEVDSIQFSHLNFITEEMAKRHNDRFGQDWKSTPGSVSSVHPEWIDINGLFEQVKKTETSFSRDKISFVPALRDREALFNYYFRPDLPVGKKRCLVPWTSASIQPNGDMIILARCFNYVVGNIMDQSLLEIWEGERYESFRKALWRNRSFPACTRCCGIL